MKLGDELGPFEARLLAEVLSQIGGLPPPKEGADVRAFLEKADPSQLLDAARHLCLLQPRRFPPELLESLSLGAKKIAEPQLHRLVLPDWKPQGVRPAGTLQERLNELEFAYWPQDEIVPEHARRVSDLRWEITNGLGVREPDLARVATLIEALFALLQQALPAPDPAANPWGADHADTWKYRCNSFARKKDDSLARLHHLLAAIAPDRSAKLGYAPSTTDIWDTRVAVPLPSLRVRRDLELAHALVSKLTHSEPASMLALSTAIADFASGRAQPFSELVQLIRLAADRVLLSPADAQLLVKRLAAVLKAWPKPKTRAEQQELSAKAKTALAKIAAATLPPSESGPLSGAVARVYWSKDGVLHKVGLEGGEIAFVRTPVPKLNQIVLAGHEVAISLLHTALGSDRAPFAVLRQDGSGQARTITAEVEGYRSKMEDRFDLKALRDGPHGSSVAFVAFVDLITAAGDLHDANLGRDKTGQLISVDREITFAPNAPLPKYWAGIDFIRFPESLLERARAWTPKDLATILSPAHLPKERITELYARLQKLLAALDESGTYHFATRR